jgi:hypothetical protein
MEEGNEEVTQEVIDGHKDLQKELRKLHECISLSAADDLLIGGLPTRRIEH